jgi:hypothetical protein
MRVFVCMRVREGLRGGVPLPAPIRRRRRHGHAVAFLFAPPPFHAWTHACTRRPAPGISDLVDPLCRMGVKLHISVSAAGERFLAQQRRRNYTTPTSYLELIRLYVGMLSQQRDVVTGKAKRYKTGLQKLYETNQVRVAGVGVRGPARDVPAPRLPPPAVVAAACVLRCFRAQLCVCPPPAVAVAACVLGYVLYFASVRVCLRGCFLESLRW